MALQGDNRASARTAAIQQYVARLAEEKPGLSWKEHFLSAAVEFYEVKGR